MTLSHHPYTDEDFLDAQSFLSELHTLSGLPQTWEFVRIEYWRWFDSPTKQKDPSFYATNAHLWKNELGKVIGLFISEHGKKYFSVFVHPDHRFLATEILNWAITVWGVDKEVIETDAYAHSIEVDALLQAGFARDEEVGNTRKYDLQGTDYLPALPDGYTVQDIDAAGDQAGKLVTIQTAFHPNDPVDQTVDYWFHRCPSYSPELDLSVISPEGRHLSFSYGWIDPNNTMGLIETIGTFPACQKRGLGKAVVSECFRRMRDKGVKTAYITGFSVAANALYQSLQPVEIYPLTSYKLEKPRAGNTREE